MLMKHFHYTVKRLKRRNFRKSHLSTSIKYLTSLKKKEPKKTQQKKPQTQPKPPPCDHNKSSDITGVLILFGGEKV